jgi:hypothetical protein
MALILCSSAGSVAGVLRANNATETAATARMPIMAYAMIFFEEPEDLLTSLRFLVNDQNPFFHHISLVGSSAFANWCNKQK